MKIFAKIMTGVGIFILAFTCLVLVLAQNQVIQIGKSLSSIVFCSLGLAFLCYSPRKYVACLENEKNSPEQNKNRRAFILELSAGIIMIIISIVKFWRLSF